MENKTYLIGNAHIDAVWLWRWQEGFAEIKATFRSALDRMKEFPEYYFTCAGACYYKWVEENCPEMFSEIQERVREGRWVIVGGWWLQPDCNLPSGESFARHGLYGQRYFKEKFGKTAIVGYNVDSFGHNAMIPQILRKSGMDSYVFMRPMWFENEIDEGGLFWWESPDGSRVLTYRIPISYCTGRDLDTMDKFAAALRQCRGEYEKRGKIKDAGMMFFYGVGNHGGGPTARLLQFLREMTADASFAPLIHGSPEDYFKNIREQNVSLPVRKDDLQHHASGCYAAFSEIKANNRKAENRLADAEAFSALAEIKAGLPYPAESFRAAWDNVMFNQFHDIMGGCCVREAYDDAREFHGQSLAIAAKAQNAALQRMSWAIDTMGGEPFSVNKDSDWAVWEVENRGVPVVVFNPHAFPIKTELQINMKAALVSDESGNALPMQLARASQTNGADVMVNTVFPVELPPMGYRVYRAYLNKNLTPPEDGGGLCASADCLENDCIKLSFESHTGYIRSIFDKKENIEVLQSPGAVSIVIDDYGNDTWSHGKFTFDRETARFDRAETTVLENGSVRAALRVTNRYGNSSLTQDFYIVPHSPDVRVKVTLDWREKDKILKLSFPCALENPVPSYEIPFGLIERPANGEEEPGLSWIDVSGENGGRAYGLSVANTAKYSYCVKNGDLRFTLARSAIFANHFGKRDGREIHMDLGIQEFSYLISPHSGSVKDSDIVKKSMILNRQPVYIMETYHKGPLPAIYSGLSVEGGVIVSAFKKSEDGRAYVLRCYEPYGTAREAVIKVPALGREWAASFAPFEIKTLYIPADGSEISERLITEW